MTNGGMRVSALVLLMLLGCASGNDAADDVGDPCDRLTATADPDGVLHVPVTDAQNMNFRSELVIGVETLKARSDFAIDWSELSVDMLAQEIDPLTGIDRLQMVVWKLPEADLVEKLNDDDLAMADVEAPGMVPTNNERTRVSYLEMETVAGTPIDGEMLLGFVDPDQYDPDLFSYTVMAGAGVNPELGFKMIHLLRFDPEAETTEVRITNESTTLAHEVDIANSDAIVLPAGNSDIVVEWADSLENNSLGNPFVPEKIWQVSVGHYRDMDVSALEDNFLDLEQLAEDFYTATVQSGASAELSALVDEDGHRFEGIDHDGIWIIALMCGDCANPAPWFFSVLRPCGV